MIRLWDPQNPFDKPAVERVQRMRTNPACQACGAHEQTPADMICMRPERVSRAAGAPTLLVVAPSPEASDLRLGSHLSGKRGRWLREQIGSRWSGNVVFDYALRCSAGSKAPSRTWLDQCRGYLARTVEASRPERILVIGSIAAQGLLGRGVDAYSAHKAWAYLADTHSFAYIIPALHDFYDNPILRRRVEGVLTWALTEATPEPPPLNAVVKRWRPRYDDEFQAWFRAASSVAYDVETYGRAADDDFRVTALTMARADSDVVWGWVEDDLTPGSEGAEVIAEALLSGKATAAHNRKFDDRAVRRHFQTPDPSGERVCSMLTHRILHGDAFVGLEIVQDTVGMGGSKDEVDPVIEAECRRLRVEAKEEAKLDPDPEAALKRSHKYNEPKAYAYAALPPDMALKYCAKDSLSTAHIAKRQKRALSEDKVFERTMGELIMPLSAALGRVEENGVRVEREHARKLQRYFGARVYDLKKELAGYADINWKSNVQLRDFLFGAEGLGLKPSILTDTGLPSTGKAALEKLREQGVEVINKVLAFRGVDKLATTYAWGLERYISDDGRIHTQYKIHGAETGRLSCVAEWTPIETSLGAVPIKHLRVGDLVWTHRGRWRPVTRVFTKGPGDMVDVRFTNGEVLTCTLDHRILDASGTWRRVEEVVDEYLEAVGRGGVEPGERLAALPRVGAPDDGADRGGARDDVPQRLARHQDGYDGARAEDVGEGALLGVEVGDQEPDARQDAGGASQLARGVRGRVRLPHDPRGEWGTGVRTPGSDGGSARAGETTSPVRCPPHRRGQEEQRAGQPRACLSTWAQGDPRAPVGGLAGLQVEAVYYRGRLEVHDLSVEEDQSYLSCGVYSHNSANPNLQNIPSGDSDDEVHAADGKRIKSLFLPSAPGWSLVGADYSQLEIRVAAMLSNDRAMLDVLASGVDFHTATGRLVAPFFNEDPMAVAKGHWLRKAAKVINFALLYGKGDAAIAEELGITLAMAAKLRQAILGRFGFLSAWIKSQEQEVIRTGAIVIPRFGLIPSRRRPLPHIASVRPGEKGNALRCAVNTPIQGCGSEYCLASVVGIDMVLNNIPLNEWQRTAEFGAWDHVERARKRYHRSLKGRAKLVATVHDSTLGDARDEVVAEYGAMTRDVMEGWPARGMLIPIDLSAGPSWGEMDDLKV